MKELVFNISEGFYSSLGEEQKGILSEKVQLLLDSLANEHVIARGDCGCDYCYSCRCDTACNCNAGPCACNRIQPCGCDNPPCPGDNG